MTFQFSKLCPSFAMFASLPQCSRVNRPRIVAGACQQGIFDLLIGVCQVAQEETCPPRRNEERSYPSLIISFASCQIPWKIWRFCETSKKILGKHGKKIWEHSPSDDYQWRFIAGKIHLNDNVPIWPPLMTPEGKNVGICMVVRAAIREPAFTQQAIRNPTVHRLISTNLAKQGVQPQYISGRKNARSCKEPNGSYISSGRETLSNSLAFHLIGNMDIQSSFSPSNYHGIGLKYHSNISWQF